MTQTNFGSFTQDAFSQMLLEQEQFTTTAQVGGTIAANVMTGGQETFILCTGNGANGLTTRTAAQMYADLTAQLGIAPPAGYSYFLRIAQQGNNTITLTGGTGVTINGTPASTILTATFRDFVVTINSPTTMTMQSVGAGDVS